MNGLEFFALESNPKREYLSVVGDQTSIMRYEITKETGGYSIDGTLELSSGVTSRVVQKIALEPDWISVAVDFHVMGFKLESLAETAVWEPTIPKLPLHLSESRVIQLDLQRTVGLEKPVTVDCRFFVCYFVHNGSVLACTETEMLDKGSRVVHWEIYAEHIGMVASYSEYSHYLLGICQNGYTLEIGYPSRKNLFKKS